VVELRLIRRFLAATISSTASTHTTELSVFLKMSYLQFIDTLTMERFAETLEISECRPLCQGRKCAAVCRSLRCLHWQRSGEAVGFPRLVHVHQFAHFRKQICHAPKFFVQKAVVHSHHIWHIGSGLHGPREIGFLIACRRIAGYRQVNPPRRRTVTSGVSQTSRAARTTPCECKFFRNITADQLRCVAQVAVPDCYTPLDCLLSSSQAGERMCFECAK
jgi:hypothetical protein